MECYAGDNSQKLNVGVSNHPRETQPSDSEETKYPEVRSSTSKAYLALFCVGKHPLLSGFIH